jgi:hypothetical protein
VKKKPNGEAKKLRTPAYRPRRTPTKAEKLARKKQSILDRAVLLMAGVYDDPDYDAMVGDDD